MVAAETKLATSAGTVRQPPRMRIPKSPSSCGTSCAAAAIHVMTPTSVLTMNDERRTDGEAADEVVETIRQEDQIRDGLFHICFDGMRMVPGEKLLHQEEQREPSDRRQERSGPRSTGRDGLGQQVQQRTTQQRPRCKCNQRKEKGFELRLSQGGREQSNPCDGAHGQRAG